MARCYALIMPCRDEAAYLPTMIASVAGQTQPPAKWIVVDDGSTDETSRILEGARGDLPYIEVIRRDDRGRRAVGPGVIEAFYVGLEHLDLDDFDYICKIDGELELPPRYFEILMDRMEQNPRLGTCSGKPYFRDERTGRLISEKCGQRCRSA